MKGKLPSEPLNEQKPDRLYTSGTLNWHRENYRGTLEHGCIVLDSDTLLPLHNQMTSPVGNQMFKRHLPFNPQQKSNLKLIFYNKICYYK